jgi:lipopolysaccharide/colanic/teichoic acid biosynthesis glycosyltransferase
MSFPSSSNPSNALNLSDLFPASVFETTPPEAEALLEALPASPFRLSFLYMPKQATPVQWVAKRVLDVAFTLLGGSFIILPLLVLALIINTTSKGGVFFKQKRIGLNGKPFYMLKFRSMYADAEARLQEVLGQNETNGGMFKMKNDPRVTPIGRFIRKYSLDEFPQLINVLRGEMSLVGPRPPLERELEAYKPWHYVRFSTLPGLTGAWQVGGRSSITTFDDVVKLDFGYIKRWSVITDLVILAKTIPVVLFGKDAA